MANVDFQSKPTITDNIVFTIKTPDVNGEFLSNPYKVNNLIIYYLEKSYLDGNTKKTTIEMVDKEIESELEQAKKTALDFPTTENLTKVEELEKELESSKQESIIYYSSSNIVQKIGTTDYPAWLSTDLDNAQITNIPEDDDGNTQYGVFQYTWQPKLIREGDYFISWCWESLPDGSKSYDYEFFRVYGDTKATTVIPTHFTKDDKYTTLFNRYLPETFKTSIKEGDLTPQTLNILNQANSDLFKFIEDMANQLQDLYDSNAVNQNILPYLANTFALKLRGSDPTRWRRQIKTAIPLNKKKGTYSGIYDALDQAGIKLTKFTRLWQVVSKYTYQEAFTITELLESEFVLSKEPISPLDFNNTEVYYRAENSDVWQELTTDYISIDGNIMTWVGNLLSFNPITLAEGDSIRIIYKYNEIPTVDEQTLETYIRTLDLMDQRDERDQTYPPKNWNVRVIEEDDALFDTIINEKNPYYDATIFGQVRTEFAYSENIYNMDEYNGSTRDSTNPCDISPDFVDSCSACVSSSFNIYLEVENLSNDRIEEAQSIINAYKPFDTQIHSISFTASIKDYVKIEENYNQLVKFNYVQYTIADPPQGIFNRVMSPLFRYDNIKVENDGQTSFNITQNAVLPSSSNEYLQILLKRNTEESFSEVDLSNITFIDSNSFTWNGDSLNENDEIIIRYQSADNLLFRGETGYLTQKHLTDSTLAASNTGTASNISKNLFCSEVQLNKLPINVNANYTELEILSGVHTGLYEVNTYNGFNIVKTEPGITYNLSNDKTVITIDYDVNVKTGVAVIDGSSVVPNGRYTMFKTINKNKLVINYSSGGDGTGGTISITNSNPNMLEISNLSDPINQTQFTFKLSNKILTKSSTTVTQKYIFKFYDDSISFLESNIKTQKDVDEGYADGAYKISVDSWGDDYDILEILSDGGLLITGNTIPTANENDVTYSIKNDLLVTLDSSTTGYLRVTKYGEVDLSSGNVVIYGETISVDDIDDFRQIINNKSCYVKISSTQYKIKDIDNDNKKINILDYAGGDAAGIATTILNRLVDNAVGNICYSGMKLVTPVNHETALSIKNGVNGTSPFEEQGEQKENFLIEIDGKYYKIKEIDGTSIIMEGEMIDWGVDSGTSVSYTINKYEKLEASIEEKPLFNLDGNVFRFIDRSGNEVYQITQESSPTISMLTEESNSSAREVSAQRERITIKIEYV